MVRNNKKNTPNPINYETIPTRATTTINSQHFQNAFVLLLLKCFQEIFEIYQMRSNKSKAE